MPDAIEMRMDYTDIWEGSGYRVSGVAEQAAQI
jgi:hypothetical protein